jgi:hypothetical protein
MLLPGAEALGMSHRECQELLESVEDTLDLLTSTLTYLIYAESKKNQPDKALISVWKAMQQEIVNIEYSLPGADVTAYKQVLRNYRERHRELRQQVARYRDN